MGNSLSRSQRRSIQWVEGRADRVIPTGILYIHTLRSLLTFVKCQTSGTSPGSHEVLCCARNPRRRGILIDASCDVAGNSPAARLAISQSASLTRISVPHVHRRMRTRLSGKPYMWVSLNYYLAPPPLHIRHAQLSSRVIDMPCSAQ